MDELQKSLKKKVQQEVLVQTCDMRQSVFDPGNDDEHDKISNENHKDIQK